ncbi:MAG TPA: helix-hairpin-helix domain-containing protein [Ktedonobacteraceae bacterium]
MSMIQLTQSIHIMPAGFSRFSKQAMQPALPGLGTGEASKPIVTNSQIAEVLSGIAALLESQNSNPYRIQAYRNAAHGVLELPEEAADILARRELLPVPGLGKRLQNRIAELVNTGTMTFYQDLSLQLLPPGARALMAIEYVGPHIAIRLHEELGIDTPEKLWWAAHRQRVRALAGFGPRSEERLKRAAAQLINRRKETKQLDGVA